MNLPEFFVDPVERARNACLENQGRVIDRGVSGNYGFRRREAQWHMAFDPDPDFAGLIGQGGKASGVRVVGLDERERVDVEFIQKIMGSGIVPVILPLGMDGEGHSCRINSDSAALEVAKAPGAVKLVFVTTAEGLAVNGSVARQVSVDELDKALQEGAVAPAQVSKARHAVAACRAGVPRVHVISGQVDEGLLAAREAGLKSLLALSTQAFNYFQSKGGFSEGNPDDLPAARRKRYEESGRRSKVLVKQLTSDTVASNVRSS